MIADLFNYGALPALERLVQFSGARHHVLTDAIANLSTPYYKPRDLDPRSFQTTLREAIDQRRNTARPEDGPLTIHDTREIRFHPDRIDARPRQTNRNILFHDQNNRDVERTMQQLAENTMAHRTGIEFLRNEFAMIRTAIRGAV